MHTAISGSMRGSRIRACGVSVAAALLLAACAGDSQQPGSVTAALPDGKSCQQLRGEIDRLDSRGVPAKIDQANAGKKLSAANQADVDQYNRLLQQYLGARCHL